MMRKIYINYPSSSSGFTLIEMMIVLVIIAIFTAIAIPSYRQYTVRNAESQALTRMKQTELELSRWRASALTYKGFYPSIVDNSGNTTYAYANSGTNTTILVPNSASPAYTITLTSDSAGANTLAVSLSNVSSTTLTTGNTWYMYATPNASLSRYGAKKILMTSNGVGCKSSASTFTSTSTCNTADTVGLEK